MATLAAGTGRQVLVVDDDATVTEVLSRYLERAGYGVVVVGDGPSALRHVAVAHPDLVVLDLLLPGMHGMEVLRRLREDSPTPVIVLTALRAEMDRVAGLESGADDVLSKPFSPGELVARVGAVLRRSTPFTSDHGSLLCLGPFEVDLRSRIVRIGGDEVAMTARELDLLVFFLRHPRQVFGRDALLERVWGYTVGDTSTVTVHVRHVREKIELDPSSPQLLKTVWGVGYRFDPPAGGADADS
ncbi:MAG: response regulator transcription factor [Actinomycetota bacterium]|nr:response regulator transcription factor [Actinomycetota bacterium]